MMHELVRAIVSYSIDQQSFRGIVLIVLAIILSSGTRLLGVSTFLGIIQFLHIGAPSTALQEKLIKPALRP